MNVPKYPLAVILFVVVSFANPVRAGNIYSRAQDILVEGNWKYATRLLNTALRTAQSREEKARILALMGNAYSVGGQHDIAITYYRESIELDKTVATTWANLSRALAQNGETDSSKVVALEALDLLDGSSMSAAAHLQALLALQTGCGCVRPEALALARSLPDSDFKKQAIAFLENSLNPREILADSQDWRSLARLARTSQHQGQKQQAMQFFEAAIAILNRLETGEGEEVYRQYLGMVLRAGNVDRALDILSKLRIQELEALLGVPCDWLEAEKIAVESAVHMVILPEETYVILEQQSANKLYRVSVDSQKLEEAAREMNRMAQDYSHNNYLIPARQLYDWLIRPLEADLPPEGATLTFVGSALSHVPLAALHDGDRYLVEKYAIERSWRADVARRPVSLERVAAFGLPDRLLISVEAELEAIAEITGAKTFLAERFTWNQLRESIAGWPQVIHIAAHADVNVAKNLGYVQAFDGEILMRDLASKLGDGRIDLLFLSACQGYNQAFVPAVVRAGVRNVVATQWYVNDGASAVFVGYFYEHLNDGHSVAEALRLAQIRMIQEEYHPMGWAAYGAGA